MSVILDALRRGRTGSAAAPSGGASSVPPAARGVPAGLGVGAASSPATGVRPARTRLFGLAALLVIGLGVWAALQVARTLVGTDGPSESSTQALPPAGIRPLPRSAPQTPPSSGAAAATPAPSTPPTGTPPTGTLAASSNEPREVSPSRPAARRPASRAPHTEPIVQNPEARVPAPASRPSSPEPRPASLDSRVASVDVNHFELALRYQNLGNFDEAQKHYLAVLAADEFNVEARNNLGLLYHRRGLTTEAIDQFRRAIAINPQYIRARSNLAVVLTDAGRLAEARAELRAAMAIEPRNVDLLVNMALVEKADKHPELAIELLGKAIGYQPTHSVAHYNIAVLYEARESLALAYDHYAEFLKYAGPEHGELLSDVQRRLLVLRPRLAAVR